MNDKSLSKIPLTVSILLLFFAAAAAGQSSAQPDAAAVVREEAEVARGSLPGVLLGNDVHLVGAFDLHEVDRIAVPLGHEEFARVAVEGDVECNRPGIRRPGESGQPAEGRGCVFPPEAVLERGDLLRRRIVDLDPGPPLVRDEVLPRIGDHGDPLLVGRIEMPRYGIAASGVGWLLGHGLVAALAVASIWRDRADSRD